jgi:CubicO group peptidase (beta-lactamase class C family)
MKSKSLVVIALAASFAASIAIAGPRQASSPEARVDAVMSRWSTTTPGCAVGVRSSDGRVFERAYGMANLEHDVANKPDTVFEAGSVSKQFTAAAVMLLARDGKLSLDDPARKYLPELPDYGAPVTIRQMLTHTSGLRDWGSLAAIAGWRRTTRMHTQAHALEIVSRQRALNFPPGMRWSYSNSGYNLAAIIVSRVSGQSFAEFTRTRIFEPLGMTRTSWRDDYRRIVKNRAIAYAPAGNTFVMDMPFENVHGNGGLLTTVGDLLRWTQNFSSPMVGDRMFVKAAQEPGRFSDGRQHVYAMGLRIVPYRGVTEVGHSGTTAGYNAYLAQYPDRQLAVALLCNAANANPTQIAHAVADIFLGLQPEEPRKPSPSTIEGLYRREDTGEPLTVPSSGSTTRLEVGSDGTATLIEQAGNTFRYVKVAAEALSPKPLADYAGQYTSDEAEVTMTAIVEQNTLVLKRRPDTSMALTPLYADAFRGAPGFVRFKRDEAGRIAGFTLTQDRVWSLDFKKQ